MYFQVPLDIKQIIQIRYAPHHTHHISYIEISRLSPGNMLIKQDLLIPQTCPSNREHNLDRVLAW